MDARKTDVSYFQGNPRSQFPCLERVPKPAAAAAEVTEVTSVVSDSVQPHRRQPTWLLCPWDSPGKNTGVGCHFLLPLSPL